MKNRVYIAIVLINLLLVFFTNESRTVVEDMSIPSAIAYDVNQNGKYTIDINSYIFRENKPDLSKTHIGEGNSLGEIRQNRQLRQDKAYVIGQEKVFIIGKNAAYDGVRKFMDLAFRNPLVNDVAYVVVYNGSARDLLDYQIPNYISVAEFIEGLMNKLYVQNFYPDDIKLIDVYVRLDAEGRNLILPYIEKYNNALKVNGLAVFKYDKMIGHINENDSKYLNILRANSGKGIITIKKDNKYMDLYGKTERKVRCFKENGKYKFNIDLFFNGNVIANEFYEDLKNNYETVKQAEQESAIILKNDIDNFIRKTKNEYKIDCFELGRVAAATFGRDKEKDWDSVVTDSEINVNVKVKIGSQGRGDY